MPGAGAAGARAGAGAGAGEGDYERVRVLGRGSYGAAVLVRRRADGRRFVMKEVDVSHMGAREREASELEARVLQNLRHPNVVRCHSSFLARRKLCIVMEWCQEGDLYGLLKKQRGQLLDEDRVLDLFVQTALAIKHCHDRKLLHRDIKSQNIFLAKGGIVKVGDFGVAKVLDSTCAMASTAIGTPYYLSPEICQNRKYSFKTDIWSLGCLLYEMTTLQHPFDAASLALLCRKIVRGTYPPVNYKYSRGLRDLIGKMLQKNPFERPTIHDVLNAPVVKSRIGRFLSETVRAHEFSHTILHGRPGRGDLLVQAPPPPAMQEHAGSEDAGAPERASGGAGGGWGAGFPARPATRVVPPPKANNVAALPSQGGRVGRWGPAAARPASAAPPGRVEAAAQKAVDRLLKEAEQVGAKSKAARAAPQRRQVKPVVFSGPPQNVANLQARRRGDPKEPVPLRAPAEVPAINPAGYGRPPANRGRVVAHRAMGGVIHRGPGFKKGQAAAAAPPFIVITESRHKKLADQRAERLDTRIEEQARKNRQEAREIESLPDRAADRQEQKPAPPRGIDLVVAPDPSAAARRRAYDEMQEAALQNKQRVREERDALPPWLKSPRAGCASRAGERKENVNDNVEAMVRSTPDKREVKSGLSPMLAAAQRRMEENDRRAAELRAFQHQNRRNFLHEAARNKRQLQADHVELDGDETHDGGGEGGTVSPPASSGQGGPVHPERPRQAAPTESEEEEEGRGDFAQMVSEMRDLYAGVGPEGCDCSPDVSASGDGNGSQSTEEKSDSGFLSLKSEFSHGHFNLNGRPLDIKAETVADRVEGLRVILERELGIEPFLSVYRLMEDIGPQDEGQEVALQIHDLLGDSKVRFVPLIHQLLICEESMNMDSLKS